jgi:hypothetical protein
VNDTSLGSFKGSALTGFTFAGNVGHRGLNIDPADPPPGRRRHAYGNGPFARLVMPPLPAEAGLYAWQMDDDVVYIGQTRMELRQRLGSNRATISTYNTLAREPGRTNGGQQTNCRINALANDALSRDSTLRIWYRICPPDLALSEERKWMSEHGRPDWNRRLE